jgi:hypothetical protein
MSRKRGLSSNPLFGQSEPTPPPHGKSLERANYQRGSDQSTGGTAKGQTDQQTDQVVSTSTDQSTDKTTDRPTDEATSQSTGQSTEQSTQGSIQLLKIVDRPKAFYITEDVNEWINKVVEHFRRQGLRKVDRSTVVNAILHDPKLWQAKSLDGLTERVVRQLTNRSVG